MIKFVPVSNAAEKALRDNGLAGFALIISGVAWLALTDNRGLRALGVFMLILGFISLLPTLVARGIQLERQSRESL